MAAAPAVGASSAAAGSSGGDNGRERARTEQDISKVISTPTLVARGIGRDIEGTAERVGTDGVEAETAQTGAIVAAAAAADLELADTELTEHMPRQLSEAAALAEREAAVLAGVEAAETERASIALAEALAQRRVVADGDNAQRERTLVAERAAFEKRRLEQVALAERRAAVVARLAAAEQDKAMLVRRAAVTARLAELEAVARVRQEESRQVEESVAAEQAIRKRRLEEAGQRAR